jgi:carbon starvation protein
MFEALFILTTIDSGTRVGRFLLQEFLGRAFPKFQDKEWAPGAMFATAMLVLGWAYFIYTGEINTIWPMFGVANQLLGVVALAVATTILINTGKLRYTWVTVLPMSFLATNTLYGGFLNVRDNFYPLAVGPDPSTNVQGWVLTICTVAMMICAVIILGQAFAKWASVISSGRATVNAEG